MEDKLTVLRKKLQSISEQPLYIDMLSLLQIKGVEAKEGKEATLLSGQTAHLALPVIASYLIVEEAKRQSIMIEIQNELMGEQKQILSEQHEVLQSMKRQSDTMSWHSWIMIVLTVVILAAMGLQIYIALKQIGWI